jgi:hypothetical protein
MYKLVIYLDTTDPLPGIGDLLEIVSIEDGNYNKFDIPYVVATLKPSKESTSNYNRFLDNITRMMGEL